MNISEINTTEINGAAYKSVDITNGKTVYNFLLVTGRFNYVIVTKKTANPFGGIIGKQFDSFDHAQENYASGMVKTMLLLAETTLKPGK